MISPQMLVQTAFEAAASKTLDRQGFQRATSSKLHFYTPAHFAETLVPCGFYVIDHFLLNHRN